MGYKRSSRKVGNTRITKTLNSNGNVTNTFSTGNTKSRVTTSYNSKTGVKQTRTYRDGAGYTHIQTLFKSRSRASILKQDRANRKMWASIGSLFSGKPKTKSRAKHKSSGVFTTLVVILLIAAIAALN